MNKTKIIRDAVNLVPGVLPFLNNRARWIVCSRIGERKTYDYFLTTLERLIRSVYAGLLGGEFIDIMASLVQGQITQAYEQAWLDEGNFLPMPGFLDAAAEAKILEQFNYVDQFFRDIIDARIDNTSIEPLIMRARLWANRFNEAYSDAMAKIALEMGGKLIWALGQTEKHCGTCSKLDGTVDYAAEWERAGLHPQGAPNSALDCEGWNCDCSLTSTTQRRTHGGLAKMGY